LLQMAQALPVLAIYDARTTNGLAACGEPKGPGRKKGGHTSR
jgi:hypothetical protein